MIDFHCHLDLYPNALALLPQVERQNQFTFAVTTSPRAFLATSRVFAGRRSIHVGLGLHPEVAQAKSAEIDLLIELVSQAPLVGEIGLDGSQRFKNSFPVQSRIFEAALHECQSQGGRVMSIHSRMAEAEVLDALARYPSAGTPVLHWFSGSQRDLRTAINMGAWFSVGPAMLTGARGRQLAELMPHSRVLPESDGPFAQYRGKPLMPWQAWDVCEGLAQAWSRPLRDVQLQMRQNLTDLVPDVSIT